MHETMVYNACDLSIPVTIKFYTHKQTTTQIKVNNKTCTLKTIFSRCVALGKTPFGRWYGFKLYGFKLLGTIAYAISCHGEIKSKECISCELCFSEGFLTLLSVLVNTVITYGQMLCFISRKTESTVSRVQQTLSMRIKIMGCINNFVVKTGKPPT